MRIPSLVFLAFACATGVVACSGGASVGPAPVAPPASGSPVGRSTPHAGASAAPGATSTPAPSPSQSGTPSPTPTSSTAASGVVANASKIKHVIIVIMENRTLDNLFQGFPGADTVASGLTHDGKTVALAPQTFEQPCDPDHFHAAWLTEYNGGKMNGWDLVPPSCSPVGTVPPVNGVTDAFVNYGYVPAAETQPYFTLAKNYALADRMFATMTGPSYPGHLYLVAGTTENQTDDPNSYVWGCDAPAGTTTPKLGAGGAVVGQVFPCIDDPTLGDLLDRKGLDWRYYTNNADYSVTSQKTSVDTVGYDAVKHIRFGPDFPKHFTTDDSQFFTDVASGNLAPMTWLNPPVIASDHAGGFTQGQTNLGPMFNEAVANAIGQSKYFDDTAILVTWDDPGGWYDHVAPPQLDDNGLGFRVPLLVISKYAKRGYVSHVQHEYGSLLKFAEEIFDTGSLGATDVRADDLSDMFDFANPAQSYTPVVNARSRQYGVRFFASLPHETGSLDSY